jgi:hypothetical protein
MMDKNILSGILGDKTETAFVIKPFHFSARHTSLLPDSLGVSDPTYHASKKPHPSGSENPQTVYVIDTRISKLEVKSLLACSRRYNPRRPMRLQTRKVVHVKSKDLLDAAFLCALQV